MYYIILTALSITTIIAGWNQYPAAVMIASMVLGHAITEALNDPT